MIRDAAEKGKPGRHLAVRLNEEEGGNTVVRFIHAVLKSNIKAEPCREMIPTLPDGHVDFREKQRFGTTTGENFHGEIAGLFRMLRKINITSKSRS